jgi:hypothetical protein
MMSADPDGDGAGEAADAEAEGGGSRVAEPLGGARIGGRDTAVSGRAGGTHRRPIAIAGVSDGSAARIAVAGAAIAAGAAVDTEATPMGASTCAWNTGAVVGLTLSGGRVGRVLAVKITAPPKPNAAAMAIAATARRRSRLARVMRGVA